jgi:hypothetical protein
MGFQKEDGMARNGLIRVTIDKWPAGFKTVIKFSKFDRIWEIS